MQGIVLAVSSNPKHNKVGKDPRDHIQLLAGLGVEGDAHLGERVQHRSRARFNPGLPNLRQVHLIHGELLDELSAQGFQLLPGQLGENVTTRGVALLDLPRGARLRLGATAVLEVTGLRNPCVQLDRMLPGLMAATLERDEAGQVTRRKAGVMAIVLLGGEVRAGDAVVVELPSGEQQPLKPV